MGKTETSTPPPRMKAWLRGVLLASLALNLAVAGVVAGMIWRHGVPDEGRHAPRSDRVTVAYIRALSPEDKRAIRDEMRAQLPGRDALRERMQDSFDTVLDSLRADPFDRDALARQMEAQFSIGADTRRLARALMLDRLEAMSTADRRAFADRVEQELEAMSHHGKSR
ncbi:periplasmic heavy metal sensor [Lutimaribacter sp. EGI FJ00015]|uniref:Periplasmic heavy metal sensor n=1 Tax=Lutimaribacter degradans TaxID=2945989 RepID=A0ACC5ZR02_9RHOB|nr:periplasmic heavy metal sensor [Lutimaribacter sp. EGI FJ00013]MCM2560753.1 periplasmic heavy metal sensor [Lutimaribacter sp. EGI FJ00013]MCO0612301.1 periplasmic heavy metal sensor [Lutimaribacter sp. EGI FJ00015]MCO0634578.1 periplasmic heavy metal sensor [Lutimaribacter sp. EGI FJ00014]